MDTVLALLQVPPMSDPLLVQSPHKPNGAFYSIYLAHCMAACRATGSIISWLCHFILWFLPTIVPSVTSHFSIWKTGTIMPIFRMEWEISIFNRLSFSYKVSSWIWLLWRNVWISLCLGRPSPSTSTLIRASDAGYHQVAADTLCKMHLSPWQLVDSTSSLGRQ